MTSKLKLAMNDIQTLWEALTPPSNPNVKFRRIRRPENIARRTFYFTLSDEGTDSEFGFNFSLVPYEFKAVIRLDLTGLDLTTAPEELADDRVLLSGTIKFQNSWSAGVRYVKVLGSKTVPTESGDVDVHMSLIAACEESDGT